MGAGAALALPKLAKSDLASPLLVVVVVVVVGPLSRGGVFGGE